VHFVTESPARIASGSAPRRQAARYRTLSKRPLVSRTRREVSTMSHRRMCRSRPFAWRSPVPSIVKEAAEIGAAALTCVNATGASAA
jgi:hypothetical protein